MLDDQNGENILFETVNAESGNMMEQEQTRFDSSDLEIKKEQVLEQEQTIFESDTDPDNKSYTSDFTTFLTLIENLKKENEELKDKALRAVADTENLRHRSKREISDARAYAVTNFSRDILNVSDNLQRAIQAVPDQKSEEVSDDFKALVEGVKMTQRDLLKVLVNHGIKKLEIEPEGQKFDPNFHQAMFEIPNPNVPHNSIAEVIQDGYMIGERVLRPAMVGVAKGGSKFEDVQYKDVSPELQEKLPET
ncbi:nucleotide exchange factor GrpE [Candidatus Endowatersipora endosymbiont of Watersipora subatra]|uniref:nucleotide exchange factor GrpE n=1 Tax=Candidatus Endowatersipora endosymbiont of Watersipora subatra TaxID=3077946 RepID=UPI00312C78D1